MMPIPESARFYHQGWPNGITRKRAKLREEAPSKKIKIKNKKKVGK